MNIKNLKYPFYLFILILLTKIGYIVVESFYNYYVLTITTSTSLTKETLENLNINGHRISALGITLLLVAFLYFLVKKMIPNKMIIILSILTIFTYILTYNGLNILIDKIVETNKDKRYEAYYVNIFKYGVLNNVFTYNSFIDNEKIKNNTLDINDRILLTNSFLLLHADKNLIEKLKERGKDKVADLYIERELKDDYEDKFNQFKKASDEISTLWNKLNENKIKLKSELSKIDDKSIKPAYDKFVNTLQDKYKKYKLAWNEVEEKIKNETTEYKLTKIQRDLNKYFKYQNYVKAQNEYKKSMYNKFGYYVEPIKWKDTSGKVSYSQIKYVIEEEIFNELRKKIGNLPSGLTVKNFMYHDETKLLVMKELKKNDILVPYEFDYSFKQFEKYFKIMSSKKYNEAYNTFYSSLEKELGKNDIKLDMNWEDFINSKYIKNNIKNKLSLEKDNDIKNILLSLQSKDLSNFKKLVYLPSVKEQVNLMMYKKEDFKDSGKASSHGDEAIKLLYVPPFALAVSILALLLNIITVIGMLMNLMNIPNKIINISKVGIFLVLIFIPIFSEYKSINNALLQKSTSQDTQMYLNFLNWISYYEKLNVGLHD